jgi:hypothetical protein
LEALFFWRSICRVMHNRLQNPEKRKMSENKDLANAVLERAREADGKKKLPCAKAFEIAREFGVAPVEVGHICNQQDIKICKCQLGCFP